MNKGYQNILELNFNLDSICIPISKLNTIHTALDLAAYYFLNVLTHLNESDTILANEVLKAEIRQKYKF